jgi:hypothetical protein
MGRTRLGNISLGDGSSYNDRGKPFILFWLLLLEFSGSYFGKLNTCYYGWHEIGRGGTKFSRNTCPNFGIVGQVLVI